MTPDLLIIITIAAGFLCAWLASHKGYSVALWLFGGGMIGLCVLALLPDASNVFKLTAEELHRRRKFGNGIAVVLILIPVLLNLVLWML